jgi:hypothetical protein
MTYEIPPSKTLRHYRGSPFGSPKNELYEIPDAIMKRGKKHD